MEVLTGASTSRRPTHESLLPCSTPYTAETHHIIDAAAIAAMKSNAVLINVGRGRCIDEAALIAGVARSVDRAQGIQWGACVAGQQSCLRIVRQRVCRTQNKDLATER
jgi:hypothetical protein